MEATMERIRQMEKKYDCLLKAWADCPNAVLTDPVCQELVNTLTDYYSGGQWLADFRLDELGLLPPDLKRGILSEDGFYNFLQEYHAAMTEDNFSAYPY